MAIVNDKDPVFLSLDDIIRLNKEKNKRSASLKSFGSYRSNRSNYSNRSNRSNYSNRSNRSNYSNRSNKSNYSNRSYGGMSRKSNMSTYSNRSRGSFRGKRGRGRGYHNYYNEQNNSYASLGRRGSFEFRNQGKGFGQVHHEFFKNRSYRGSNQNGYNYWSNGRYPYNHLHKVNTYSLARNRVKNALKYLNKSRQNYGERYTPYQTVKRQLTRKRWITQSFTDDPDDREDINGLSIVVKNDKAFPSLRRTTGLTARHLAQFNENNVSPLRKTSIVLSRKTASVKKNSSWGPKLNPEIQEEIENFMQNSGFISEDLSASLNENKIVPSTTSLLLHERFGSYL